MTLKSLQGLLSVALIVLTRKCARIHLCPKIWFLKRNHLHMSQLKCLTKTMLLNSTWVYLWITQSIRMRIEFHLEWDSLRENLNNSKLQTLCKIPSLSSPVTEKMGLWLEKATKMAIMWIMGTYLAQVAVIPDWVMTLKIETLELLLVICYLRRDRVFRMIQMNIPVLF